MTSCDTHFNSIDWSKEPNAVFWTQENCNGTFFEQTSDSTSNPLFPADKVKSLFVPPNHKLLAFSKPNMSGLLMQLPPGYYRTNRSNPQGGYELTGISSAHLLRDSSWEDHIIDCCKGNKNPKDCGTFDGISPTHNGDCDIIMENYCKTHKDDPKCSCYISTDPIFKNPEIDKLVKNNPKCYIQDCLLSGYKPTGIRNADCPSLKICIQDFANITGSENKLSSNVVSQDCSDPSLLSSPSPLSSPLSSPSPSPLSSPSQIPLDQDQMFYILIIIFIIVVVIFLVLGIKKVMSGQHRQL
jgi:hypothetical protein